MNMGIIRQTPRALRGERTFPLNAALALAVGSCLLPASGVAADRFCSTTTNAVFQACQNAGEEDYLIALGKCINVSDKDERRACLREAGTARGDALRACRAQMRSRNRICRALGEARYEPNTDPALFDSDFRNLPNPNRYFPLKVGNKWEFGGAESVVVEVLDKTKLIEGVTCAVVNDRVMVGGEVLEDTDDWFAQAKNGDVYCFGEAVKEYESFDGDSPREPELLAIDGSFKTGREGDKPGFAFLSAPKPGQVYRQEYSLNNAEDIAEIVSTTYTFGQDAELDRLVPRALAELLCAGDCVVTKEYQPLRPGVFERKFYAPGIGGFLVIHLDSAEVVQLVGCNFDSRCAALPTP